MNDCFDKNDFLNELKYFCDQAIENAKNGTIVGSKIAEPEKRLNKVLEASKLECCIDFGSGKTAGQQGIAFVRQDVLGTRYVNGEKVTPRQGIYIWFCYFKEEKNFCLEFGFSLEKEKEDCEAFGKMKADGCFGAEYGKFRKSYSDFESYKDKIMADFLDFVAYYKEFKASDFIRILPIKPDIIAVANGHDDKGTAAIMPDTMNIKSK